jgi:hypothetical protein
MMSHGPKPISRWARGDSPTTHWSDDQPTRWTSRPPVNMLASYLESAQADGSSSLRPEALSDMPEAAAAWRDWRQNATKDRAIVLAASPTSFRMCGDPNGRRRRTTRMSDQHARDCCCERLL